MNKRPKLVQILSRSFPCWLSKLLFFKIFSLIKYIFCNSCSLNVYFSCQFKLNSITLCKLGQMWLNRRSGVFKNLYQLIFFVLILIINTINCHQLKSAYTGILTWRPEMKLLKLSYLHHKTNILCYSHCFQFSAAQQIRSE